MVKKRNINTFHLRHSLTLYNASGYYKNIVKPLGYKSEYSQIKLRIKHSCFQRKLALKISDLQEEIFEGFFRTIPGP
jgi:hypothetical protein